jgi:hypothetical protein
MKTLKKSGLILLLLVCGFSGMYAQTQTKTAYEKKITEITTKYFKIFYGYNRALTMYEQAQIDLLTDSELGQAFLAVGILSYAVYHTEAQVKSMVKQMEFDYMQAEKLKTSVDIQREKARKEEQARKEKEEAEQKAREIYLRSDRGKIEENIKTAFEKWAAKGEFESSAKYEERLKNQSESKFTETCIEQIRERTNGNIYKELLPYDADNECFTIKFSKECGYACGIEWQSKLNIPINQAKDFKGHFRDGYYSYSRQGDFYTEINDYDWCFVNDTLCPTMVTLLRGEETFNREKNQREFITKESYNLPVNIPNQTEITIPFDNLEIENQHLKGFVLKYSEIVRKIAREKFMVDSIAKREKFVQDSLCNEYSNKIKKNADIYADSIMIIQKQVQKIEKNNNIFWNESAPTTMNGRRFVELEKDAFSKLYSKIKNIQVADKICNENDFNTAQNKIVQNYKDYKEFADEFTWEKFTDYAKMDMTYYGVDADRLNTARSKVLISMMDDSKGTPNYPKMIDFVIENNYKLNNEWTKNGQFFESKVDFWNAYISGNYKQILKERKKNE